MALPIIGLTGTALVIFAVLMSLPAVIIGYGLYQFRPWARIAGIVLSILSLVVFPFGTLLGVYGLWVLFERRGTAVHRGAHDAGVTSGITASLSRRRCRLEKHDLLAIDPERHTW